MTRGHFEREAYIQWGYLLPFAIGLVVVMIGLKCVPMLQTDACLDRGGSWNYDEGTCDFEESHPGPD